MDSPPCEMRVGRFWAVNAKQMLLNGQPIEVYGIQALACALHRSPATVRRWERAGVLQPCPYWKWGVDRRGHRRYYLGDYIEALREAAMSEGVLEDSRIPLWWTRFPDRAKAIWYAHHSATV